MPCCSTEQGLCIREEHVHIHCTYTPPMAGLCMYTYNVSSQSPLSSQTHTLTHYASTHVHTHPSLPPCLPLLFPSSLLVSVQSASWSVLTCACTCSCNALCEMQCSCRHFECLWWLIVSPHLIPALLALCFEVQDFPRV